MSLWSRPRGLFLFLISFALSLTLCSCNGGGGGDSGGVNGGASGGGGGGGSTGGSTTPASPACSVTIAAEAAAQGDYRALSHQTGISIGAVAISNRGWRAVAGGQDGNIYFFHRSQASPQFTYTTGDQVNTVDISRNGEAFVAGSLDGRIYYFECDQTTPAWIYDTAPDLTSGTPEVVGVSISEDGRWIAAVSRYHVYLFRRDNTTPVLNLQLSSNASLATVALSADGSRLAVGTGPEGTEARVFYLNQQGLLWTAQIPDLGWGPNDLPTPVAISADGSVIAAGGRDNRIHLWSGASSTPLWTYHIADESPVFSVALSDDGTRLAATGNFTLYYFDNASTPTFTHEGSYGSPSFFGQPVVYPGMDNAPGDYGIGNYLHAVALSSDGSYLAAGDYVYGHAFSFYREFNQPFRMYDLAYDYDSVGEVDISPDGSWIMLGSVYNGEILRIEVAPVEIIRVQVPITYRVAEPFDEIAELIGGTQFDVDYWILKPGRAAHFEENWSMWALPAMGAGGVIPPGTFCTGDTEWTYDQNLADGNQVITGTRQLSPPQCLESTVSTIDLFLLHAELHDQPTNTELSDDSETLATVQVGTGGG